MDRKAHQLYDHGIAHRQTLHLWPEMWRHFECNARWIQRPSPVRWRNYYDYADPVGYELDSAEKKLKTWKCESFEGKVADHDHGFRRYPLPGKAHLDYFRDDELFAHVIEDAVGFKDAVGAEGAADKPGDNWRGWCSPAVPFLIVGAVLFAAVSILDRGLILTEESRIGFQRKGWKLFTTNPSHLLFGQWGFLVGTTVLARILRLTRTSGMIALAFVLFLLGSVGFYFFPEATGLEAGYRAGGSLFTDRRNSEWLEQVSKLVVIWWAFLAVGAAWLADYIACLNRWRPVWALRIFILIGTAFMGGTLFWPRLLIAKEESALALLGSLAGFAALWWFGTLLFDLAFCWQRYINCSKSWLDRIKPEEQ